MSVIHAPRKPQLDARILVFPIVLLLLFSLLLLRLWYFQVVKAPELLERAAASREKSVKQQAPRGLMYDRNGILVGGVRQDNVVMVTPGDVRKQPEILTRIAEVLQVDEKKLRRKLEGRPWPSHMPMPIFVGASIESATVLAEADLPGVRVERLPMRYYPDTVSFTHVLGYVGLPNEKDLERFKEMDLEVPEYVGKAGVEKAYDPELIGRAGAERMQVDARQRPIRLIGRDNPSPGAQLTLTLDARLQKYATQLLGQQKFVGGVAALDPSTGEVLCLVSSPTFDQRLFEGGISLTEWNELQQDEAKPMMNRPIQSAYSPGSTFKIVTTLAALQTGKFDPNATVYCNGGYRIGRHITRCLGRHGSISFQRAMQKSCNTYFCTIGRAAGVEALRKAALSVGLYERTGIEIGGESRGLVPTEEWIQKHRNPPQWFPGDTLNFSIGQGELRATPIQMANVAALVANNGVNYRPHLVRAAQPANSNEVKHVQPEILHSVEAPDQFWATMRSSLVSVIHGGTAGVAQIPGMTWGGKTGSTEHRKGRKTHGWFVGFAPAENPKIAICVLIEAAGHGGEVAAPIAREIVKYYLSKPAKASENASAADVASAASPGNFASR